MVKANSNNYVSNNSKRCQALLLRLLRPRFGLSHSSVRDIYFHALNYASKSLLVITNLPSSFPLTFPPPALSHPRFTNIVSLKLLKYPPSPPHPHVVMHSQMLQGLRNLLSTREPKSRPVCAVIDVMMGWTADVFKSFEVPIVGLFTSGACSAAVECAMWQARIQDVKPGEARLLPGLPEDMALFESDQKHRPPLRGAPGSEKIGPPKAGDQPHWMKEVEGSMALMFNTCDGLEGPFINYLANQLGKPVWGVGPLLPKQFTNRPVQ